MAGRLKADRQVLATFARVGHVGVLFLVSAALFTYLGYVADEWLGTLPLFLVIGVLSGNAIGTYAVYRQLVAGSSDKSPAKDSSDGKE